MPRLIPTARPRRNGSAAVVPAVSAMPGWGCANAVPATAPSASTGATENRYLMESIVYFRMQSMHETVIARKLIEDAKGQGDVSAITVSVGEVAPTTKEDLEPALRALSGWDVRIEEVKAKAACACGYEGPPRILARGHDACLYECPRCGRAPEITAGKEIVLKSVELR
jgi:hydrogenase nickel incorporation protein HypA/HybF